MKRLLVLAAIIYTLDGPIEIQGFIFNESSFSMLSISVKF